MSASLVIGILSTDGEELRRQAILDTWGSDALDHPEVDLVFLIGRPDLTSPIRDGICLYLPCPDDYISLPQKTRWFCLWGLANTNAKYFFKVDDDTYVRVDRLVAATKDNRWKKPLIGCRGGRGTKANLQGGAGYMLTREGAMILAAYMLKEEGSEDRQARASIEKAGFHYAYESRFYYRFSWRPEPDNEQITTHRCHPDRMRMVHRNFDEL